MRSMINHKLTNDIHSKKPYTAIELDNAKSVIKGLSISKKTSIGVGSNNITSKYRKNFVPEFESQSTTQKNLYSTNTNEENFIVESNRHKFNTQINKVSPFSGNIYYNNSTRTGNLNSKVGSYSINQIEKSHKGGVDVRNQYQTKNLYSDYNLNVNSNQNPNKNTNYYSKNTTVNTNQYQYQNQNNNPNIKVKDYGNIETDSKYNKNYKGVNNKSDIIENIPIDNYINEIDRPIKENTLPEEVKEYDEITDEMIECNTCARKFVSESYQKHIKVCKKVFVNKRKPFDLKKMRIINEEHEQLVKRSEKEEKKIGNFKRQVVKARKWKKQSEELRAVMKVKVNKDSNNKEPIVSTAYDDYIHCQHCNRKYNEQAYNKHLNFCSKKARESVMKGKINMSSKPSLNMKFNYK